MGCRASKYAAPGGSQSSPTQHVPTLLTACIKCQHDKPVPQNVSKEADKFGGCVTVRTPDDEFVECLRSPQRLSGAKCWRVVSRTDEKDYTEFKVKPVAWMGDLCEPNREGVGYACHKGRKSMPNQDSFTVLRAQGAFSLYGVFDGHGRDGHHVSDYVARKFPELVFGDSRLQMGKVASLLTDAFAEMQVMIGDATARGELFALESGTTATVVVHDHLNGKLTIAHVGDSLCCLGTLRGRRASSVATYGVAEWFKRSKNRSSSKQLTEGHKPEHEDEKLRIELAGGVVRHDGYTNFRIFSGDSGWPAINMSRALGDLNANKSVGLSAVPTVTERDILRGDDVLILCSDGVWEFCEPDDVVNLVASVGLDNPMQAASALSEESWRRWIHEEGGEAVDDITAIVVSLAISANAPAPAIARSVAV